MYIYFTTNDKFYSKLLMWLTDEPTSHVAVGFYFGGKINVIEATKPRARLLSYKSFKKSHTIVNALKLDLGFDDELDVYSKTIKTMLGKPYDWPAYFYGFWRSILRKFFNIPYPKINRFNDSKKQLCTEILDPLKMFFASRGIDIIMDLSAKSPHGLYLHLKKQPGIKCLK